MVVTLGGIDISQSEVSYERKARIGRVKVPNRYGDVKQAFGTESYEVDITGVWTGNDPRGSFWGWEANNTPVTLTFTAPDASEDISGRSFLIESFKPKLVQGIPSSILINFTFHLTEAI